MAYLQHTSNFGPLRIKQIALFGLRSQQCVTWQFKIRCGWLTSDHERGYPLLKQQATWQVLHAL